MLLFTGGPPAEVGKRVNLVPLATVTNALDEGHTGAIQILVVNVILLVPVGVALAVLRGGSRLGSSALIIVGTSVSIEVVQHLIPGARSSDIDDVILNSVGGMLALALTTFVLSRVRESAPDPVHSR